MFYINHIYNDLKRSSTRKADNHRKLILSAPSFLYCHHNFSISSFEIIVFW